MPVESEGEYKLVCGRTRAKISKIQGPSMPKKNEGIFELQGLWNCLKFLTGHPPSSFCTSPKSLFSLHLLLLMAQEHPIFGQQFF